MGCFIEYDICMSSTHPQQSEWVLLFQLFLDLMDGSLQAGDLHAEQGLVLVQSDQLPALLCLQLHLQQLLLLVQELVQVAELGLNALLQVSSVLLSRKRMMDSVTASSCFCFTFLKNLWLRNYKDGRHYCFCFAHFFLNLVLIGRQDIQMQRRLQCLHYEMLPRLEVFPLTLSFLTSSSASLSHCRAVLSSALRESMELFRDA